MSFHRTIFLWSRKSDINTSSCTVKEDVGIRFRATLIIKTLTVALKRMYKGRIALRTNFNFGLKKIGQKIKLHQTRIENKLELKKGRISTSENASVNHTGEIWAVKLCSVTTLAMRPNRVTVTLRFALFGAHKRPNWGCIAQFLKEGILLTSWHLMAVVSKGKISPLHAVASNCMQWKRQCKWWNVALFFTFVTLPAGSFGFSRFGKIGPARPSTPASLMFFPDFEIYKKSQMRSRIWKEVCWQILVLRVNNYPQNRL